MRKFLSFSLLIILLFSNSVFTQEQRQLVRESTEKRTALVIGNGDYINARKLANPANDAADMAKALGELGFDVVSGINLNLKQMNDKIREFGDKLKTSGGVGLFYYAGHGVQANGKNYLIPVEADISREDEIDFAALNFDQVLRKMATANNGLNIVILDACRNNPFARSWSRDASEGGLAQVNAPTGTFIAYATSPDKTASDGTGRNGLYTAELLKYIKQPDLKIEETFKEVRKSVNQTSKGAQIPWDSSSLSGDFYFKPIKPDSTSNVSTQNNTKTPIVAKDKAAQEREAWDLVKNSSSASDFRYFLEEFPNGDNAANAKIRLEELVWQSVRGSDKTKIQSYLNEFPNGANSAAARIRLKQLDTAGTTPENTENENTTNRIAGAIRKSKLSENVEMSFVFIPAGEFQMGSTKSENEQPIHTVKISHEFWLQQTEVTQEQWKTIMGNTPSQFKNCPACPVEFVSWNEVQDFISKLNARNDGYKYRLPTEAEWEYAARAGTTGDFAGKLDEMAWYDNNSQDKTHPVGQKKPNKWGLYDMHGNVGEIVQDTLGGYPSGTVTDPLTTIVNWTHVVRGGCWLNTSSSVRSASRSSIEENGQSSCDGLRLLRE